jgi:STE24 endopeptidase
MGSVLGPSVETARYIDSLGTAALAKAETYTLGNHGILLAGVGVSLLLAWIMIRFRLVDRIAERLTGRSWFVATLLTGFGFFVLADILRLPWTIYADWFRERSYGMTSQPLGDFLGQAAFGGMISATISGLFVTGIYALIRKAGQRWWLWAAGLTGVVTTAMLLAAPILLMPLFNEFKPLPQGEVRKAIEAIADDTGIPHDRIFVYDGSRQSEHFTANVAGIGRTARIAISDVALKEASLNEVRAVTAHEAGHYMLGHTWRYVFIFPLGAALLLWLVQRLFAPTARLFGSDARLHEPRGLPVFMALVAVLSLFTMPIQNGLSRLGESEADRFSLATVGLPDALASALIKTAEYRYPRPHPLQEALFYTHPSIEKRILVAMEWKAQHSETKSQEP